MGQQRILKPGRNCWRIRHAERVAFLVDGDAYFENLYHGLHQAECQVLVLSWDIYSRLRLLSVGGVKDSECPEFSELLNRLVEDHQRLRVYILNWDFSVIYALSREWLPIYRLDWATHPRVHFELDDQCPVGSSHHQKVVVIDDALAFAGGLDLTRGRWDTPEHKPDDARREAVDGTRGRPFHDVQMAVSGPVAAALGDLARERWRRATGETLAPPGSAGPAIWPEGLDPDLEHVEVAIARTEPANGDYADVHEVEQLYLDSIAAACDYIYIENQYFTAPAVADALAARLAEPDGPEVIINLPLLTDGWLANLSMDVIRVNLIGKLRAAERSPRLAVYYPQLPHKHGDPINLHAKLMIIDDRFVRLGSSNLNNRSLGLDTECDLAIEAAGQDRIKAAIRGLRNRLLGEHLNVAPEELDAAMQTHGTLVAAIESLRSSGRSLSALEPAFANVERSPLSDAELMDPERPVNPDDLLDRFVPEQDTRPAGRRILGWLLTMLVMLALAAAWHFTGLSEWADAEMLSNSIARLSHSPATPLIIMAVFVVAGFLLVPLTVLVIATVVAFGPLFGFGYAFLGALASGVAGYAAGAGLGRRGVRRLAGKRINAVSRRLAKRGLLTVMVVRIVPVAPFTVINLVAGASHIGLRDFIWGTLLGMAPGMLAIALLADRAAASLRDPHWANLLTLILVAVGILLAGYLLSRQLLGRARGGSDRAQDKHD